MSSAKQCANKHCHRKLKISNAKSNNSLEMMDSFIKIFDSSNVSRPLILI